MSADTANGHIKPNELKRFSAAVSFDMNQEARGCGNVVVMRLATVCGTRPLPLEIARLTDASGVDSTHIPH